MVPFFSLQYLHVTSDLVMVGGGVSVLTNVSFYFLSHLILNRPLDVDNILTCSFVSVFLGT